MCLTFLSLAFVSEVSKPYWIDETVEMHNRHAGRKPREIHPYVVEGLMHSLSSDLECPSAENEA